MFLNSTTESARSILLQASLGPMLSKALCIAVQLNIADLLKDGSKSATELAEATGTHAPSLYRMLRFLSGFEIFVEDDGGLFALTDLSQFICSDSPDSLRDWILFNTEAWRWDIVQAMQDSIFTGKTAYEVLYQKNIYEVLPEKPEWNATFNKGVQSWTGRLPEALLNVYDFSQVKTIVDIGGGLGSLLAPILKANPNLRGILFDRPQVLQDSKKFVESHGVVDRCEFVGGNFLNAVPEGGDLYLISYVFTDWPNEDCIRVLHNCSQVMAPNAKVLILEPFVGSRNQPTIGKAADLIMLLETGGRIRDEQEWETILQKTPFTPTKIIPTNHLSVNLIEATRRENASL
jgi:O-methyltransferase domain/Dimerisation domain